MNYYNLCRASVYNVLSQIPGFPGGSDGKESTHNAGDPGSIPGLGRFPGKGNGNPFAWRILWTEESGVLKSWSRKELDTTEATSTFTSIMSLDHQIYVIDVISPVL